ncbi:Ankyrin-3 [Arthrobotrys entomopaga]|nr:Ankyrin-3 [Arthrobotrys entomopaga]
MAMQWHFHSASKQHAQTQAFDAARTGDVKTLEKILNEYEDATQWKDPFGWGDTLLLVAARNSRPKIVLLLLSKGASILARGASSDRPIHAALRSPRRADAAADTVTILLEHRANVNDSHDYDGTPLHLASLASNLPPSIEIAKILIKWDAEFTAKKIAGFPAFRASPIHCAVFHKRPELVDYYLGLGKSRIQNFDQVTAGILCLAMERKYWDMIDIMLHHGIDPNQRYLGTRPLHKAIELNKMSIVQTLLDYGADPSLELDDGETPLSYASRHRDAPEYGILLINKGADPTAVDRKGKTPLHHFLYTDGFREIAQMLLDRGADIDARDQEGKTPLHYLLLTPNRNDHDVKFLLEHGALQSRHGALANFSLGPNVNLAAVDYTTSEILSGTGDVGRKRPTQALAPLFDPNFLKSVQEITQQLGFTRQQAGETPMPISKTRSSTRSPMQGKLPQQRVKENPKPQIDQRLSEELKELNLKGKQRERESDPQESDEQRRWKEQREFKRQTEWERRRRSIEMREKQDAERIWQGGTLAEHGDTTPRDWLRRVEKLHAVLQGHISDDERVKIAIIDSGVHDDHPQSELIRKYKDFTGTGTPGVRLDKTSHGSTGVDLIAQVSPDADLYIARVFEEKHAKEGTQDLIAEAVRWAQEEWNVDIITLACGFESWHEDMASAIRDAHNKGILIFAAASNEGNIEGIKFPAYLYDDGVVFCVFACDSMGKVKNNFNPAPTRYDLNFAFLGENVPVSSHPTKNTQTGTSYATFIGAAVAALVLDFARQGVRNPHKLKKFRGMSAVFKLMARGGKDGEYECVGPWKLMGIPPRSRDNAILRTIIRETISVHLDDVPG